MQWVDPFKDLPDDLKALLSTQGSQRREADKNFKEIVGQYRELLEDQRYTKIKSQIIATIASELRLLVDEAAKVPATSARASRIKVLENMLSEPLEALWLADQEKDLSSPSEV